MTHRFHALVGDLLQLAGLAVQGLVQDLEDLLALRRDVGAGGQRTWGIETGNSRYRGGLKRETAGIEGD